MRVHSASNEFFGRLRIVAQRKGLLRGCSVGMEGRHACKSFTRRIREALPKNGVACRVVALQVP